MRQVGKDGFVISGPVHRALNDMVLTANRRSYCWEGNYEIFIGQDGQVKGEATKPSLINFESGFIEKIVMLPTPEWVQDSEQKIYVCFHYEVAKMMEKWWKEFSHLLS